MTVVCLGGRLGLGGGRGGSGGGRSAGGGAPGEGVMKKIGRRGYNKHKDRAKKQWNFAKGGWLGVGLKDRARGDDTE